MKDKYKVKRSRRQFRKPALTKPEKKEVNTLIKRVFVKNTEYKQYSKSQASIAVHTTAPYFSHLTNLGQNFTDATRVGDEFTLKSITARVGFNNGGAATSNAFVTWRIVVFQYKNSDVTPVATKMFLGSAAHPASAAGPFSSYDIDYRGEYVVLYDKILTTQIGVPAAAVAMAQTGELYKFMQFTVPLKYCKKKIQFVSASTNPVNGVWMLVMNDVATIGAGPDPLLRWNVDIHYTDS